MTRDLDLLKIDVDVLAMIIRLRGVPAPQFTDGEHAVEAEPDREGA